LFNQNGDALNNTQYGNKFGVIFSFLSGLRLENTQLKGLVTGVDLATLQEAIGEGVDLDLIKII